MAVQTTKLQNFWSLAAGDAAQFPALDADIDCDVVIIGAGIMGLSCALTLAEKGKRVVVVEASQPAEGASGSNGGLVVPSLPRLGPSDVRRLLGEASGTSIIRMVAESAQNVFDTIARYGIACDARQSGWLNPAHACELEAGLRARVADWQTVGGRAQWLDRDTTREHTGTDAFCGALFDPSGGHLNPYAYTIGLAKAASNAGARIFGRTPAKRVVRDGPRRIVTTGRGNVCARTVIQCTNALGAGALEPSVSRSVVPLTVFQLVTNVLPAEVRAMVLTGGEALSDTRNNLFSLRHTADGRLGTGGMAHLTQWHAEARLIPALERRLKRLFPVLEDASFEYIWRGTAALTPDFLPRVMRVDAHWLAPIGCNGRGIAMSTSLGKAIAEYVVDAQHASLPLPLTPPHPIRAHGLARYLPQLLLPLGTLQDALRK